jgi:hypothetical protein
MAYYLDLFSPETYQAFSNSNRDVSGFRIRQEKTASRIQPGDILICYMTKLSRWIGLLEVTSPYFIDSTPLFIDKEDPFIVRFKVKPIVWLDEEQSIPIRDDEIWSSLSFTKGQEKTSAQWTGRVRSSLSQINQRDGQFLEKTLRNQEKAQKAYLFDDRERHKFTTHTIRRLDKTVAVSVPQDSDVEPEGTVPRINEVRDSTKIQALLGKIGAKMGMRIWVPRNDRTAVINEWKDEDIALIDILPLNYDETTLKTIEQIDVLWLRGRAIVRAFEVEHTTSIYSGILRMADLLALQPNMDIKLHIVAPYERREKVFQEIRRPVFSLLEKGPLSESCTFLSYDSLRELAQQKHLVHLSDSVLDEYAEEAE